MKSEPSKQDIRAENSRRAKILEGLQRVIQRVMEDFRQLARERGVLTDDWIKWFKRGYISVEVNINPKQPPLGPYYVWLSLYKDGSIVLHPSDRQRPYGYPDFTDNAIKNLRPRMKREFQRWLDEYCADRG